MPFPIVYGLPDATSDDLLRQIRADIISKLAEAMGISPSVIRPFFPVEMIGDPDEGQDNTIYCRVDSSMLASASLGIRQKATSVVAEVIWRAFGGKIEVEVFIGDLNGTGKTLRRPTLTSFTVDGKEQEVVYVETEDLAPGVLVDIYAFVGDDTKDLAIVTVLPGFKTPLQQVLKGVRTIEGYVSGKGAYLNDKQIFVNGINSIEKSVVDYNFSYTTPNQLRNLITENLRDKKIKRALDLWCGGYSFCLLASGKIEAVLVEGDELYDFIAGKLIAKEAGALITDFNGKAETNMSNNRFIASNGQIVHLELVNILTGK